MVLTAAVLVPHGVLAQQRGTAAAPAPAAAPAARGRRLAWPTASRICPASGGRAAMSVGGASAADAGVGAARRGRCTTGDDHEPLQARGDGVQQETWRQRRSDAQVRAHRLRDAQREPVRRRRRRADRRHAQIRRDADGNVPWLAGGADRRPAAPRGGAALVSRRLRGPLGRRRVRHGDEELHRRHLDLGRGPRVTAFRPAADRRALSPREREHAGDRGDHSRSEDADGAVDGAEADPDAGAVRPDHAARLSGPEQARGRPRRAGRDGS